MARQLGNGAIFDVLIGNSDRKPDDILCVIGADRLYFIDHSKAFSTSTEIDWDRATIGAVDPGFLSAIQRIDRQSLIQEVGELLSEPQIDALLTRRDQILERAVTTAVDPEKEQLESPSGRSGSH